MTLWAPDSTNLVFEHQFGGDSAASLLNHVTGTTTASLIGTPTYGTGYMDINGNPASPKGLDYGFGVTQDEATIIAVIDPNSGVGIVSSVGTNPALAATGRVWFDANTSAGETLSLNGQAITFVSSGAAGMQVDIGSGPQATAQATTTLINANPAAFAVAAFCPPGNSVLELTALAAGTSGNGIAMSSSSGSIRLTTATATSGIATLSTGSDGEAVTAGIVQSSTNLTGRNSSFGAGGLASIPAPVAAGYHYISTTLRVRDFPELRSYSAGVLSARGLGTVAGRSRDTAANLQSAITSIAGTGNAKIAYAALFDGRILTDAEDLAHYSAVKTAAASAGISVA
ncbi:MAG: hypothetical protein GC145_08630 [Caulobacter sp.]|nr:hypothetical protein [Caulobacter sp.]